ncbi:MAG: galactokinase [Actinomycetes bacterium]
MSAPRPPDRIAALAGALDAPVASLTAVRAPGRVNLIGEHVDYNDGVVLPLAIDRDTLVAWRLRTDRRTTARSLEIPGLVECGPEGTTSGPAWGAFVPAAAQAAVGLGAAPVALDLAVTSTVPAGGGLSSSAALSVALVLAHCVAGGLDPDRRALALAAREVEVEATGVPVGTMDQLASALGLAGHVLRIDCRNLAVDPVAIPDDLAVLVVHSGIERTLAGSEYAQRRAACEDAARRLGLGSLRDARNEQVADDPFARHVVAEIARVDAVVAALRADAPTTVGRLLLEGHASLRDDFGVSRPEIDTLVDLLVDAGAHGARITGAGFGGCVVAITDPDAVTSIAARAGERYAAATGRTPRPFVVRAASGAAPC